MAGEVYILEIQTNGERPDDEWEWVIEGVFSSEAAAQTYLAELSTHEFPVIVDVALTRWPIES